MEISIVNPSPCVLHKHSGPEKPDSSLLLPCFTQLHCALQRSERVSGPSTPPARTQLGAPQDLRQCSFVGSSTSAHASPDT